MGWKGTLRSVNAELNRQARASEKRHRQNLKEQQREDAYNIVQDQDDYFHRITSLHQKCRASLNWDKIEASKPPKMPIPDTPLTDKAVQALENFKPNFLVRLLSLQGVRRKRLEEQITKSKQIDAENLAQTMKAYEKRKQTWDKNQDLLKRLKTDGNALIEALQEHLNISDLPIGKLVEFEVSDEMQVDVYLTVLPFEEIVPNELYSLRQSGTLSTKKIPKGKGLELYQDHVCSALLRAARETLGVIPVDFIRANALVHGVNTQTGHLENQIILSAVVVRETLKSLKLNNIDPSDSMNNFVFNTNFKKTKGFEVVEKVDIPPSLGCISTFSTTSKPLVFLKL